MDVTSTFRKFTESERAGGMLLLACTLVAIAIANSPLGDRWAAGWQTEVAGMSLAHWVNDGLMAAFFLLVGLELEREIYVGELSDLRKALFPIVAAIGGMLAPAGVHFWLNGGTPTQPGAGIPMATDIAFALAALALLGSRVPLSLKVFLTAFAVMDDLGAILIIAAAYTSHLSGLYLLAAVICFAILIALNRLGVASLALYLAGGVLLWFLVLRSGVHATVAGVLLAFAIPFRTLRGAAVSPSERLEGWLHKPVAFVVLPVFALANTGVAIGDGVRQLADANSLGIVAGLVLGKPLGITLACALAVAVGLAERPGELRWSHIVGAGFLGGIGFTMSIFITNLAFGSDPALVNASKIAVLAASATAALAGVAWLRWVPAGRACAHGRHEQSVAESAVPNDNGGHRP